MNLFLFFFLHIISADSNDSFARARLCASEHRSRCKSFAHTYSFHALLICIPSAACRVFCRFLIWRRWLVICALCMCVSECFCFLFYGAASSKPFTPHGELSSFYFLLISTCRVTHLQISGTTSDVTVLQISIDCTLHTHTYTKLWSIIIILNRLRASIEPRSTLRSIKTTKIVSHPLTTKSQLINNRRKQPHQNINI